MAALEGVLSEAQARALTDSIKAAVTDVWLRISEAYQGRAWLGLGYPSWDTYCSAEFKGARLQLPSEERREIVASLRESGLSLRAIASATTASPRTIRRDLAAGGANATPARRPSVEEPEPGGPVEVVPHFKDSMKPAPVKGTDGKSYPATKPAPAEPRPDPFAADRYRQAFLKDVARVMQILNSYDVERVADLSVPETWESIDGMERVVTSFVKRVRGCKPQGLRVVGGSE